MKRVLTPAINWKYIEQNASPLKDIYIWEREEYRGGDRVVDGSGKVEQVTSPVGYVCSVTQAKKQHNQ